MNRFRYFITLVLCSFSAFADSSLWQDVQETGIESTGARIVSPTQARSVALDLEGLKQRLESAPMESAVAASRSDFILSLPNPDGSFEDFRVVESPIMEPELAKKYRQFRTYLGQSVDDPSATVRFDLTQLGFRAQIISWRGTRYIEPLQRGDTTHYLAFRKNDLPRGTETFSCGVQSNAKDLPNFQKIGVMPKVSSGATLRTHRLAMAATGEYTVFHGGTVADGLGAIITTMNRVNGIYEREVSVRMVLVANNDLLIYTNAATDPYANTSGDLAANQTNITTVIGTANFDVGHLVGTGGGGIAGLGVICNASNKARGLTGSGSPVGDAFDIDYVAHELGHQYAGNHTFNGTGVNCSGTNRNGSTAYEPGSGITIQAYAGICGADNTQPNSEDYFHRVSLNEILTHVTTGSGSTCGTTTSTGNNPPTVNAGNDFTIPINTPFSLTGSGSDVDGDALTYVWEQWNLGAQQTTAGALNNDNARPIFRSFLPQLTAERTFPSWRYILNNSNVPPTPLPLPGTSSPSFFTAEALPAVARTLVFRLTARDNRAGGGGTNEDEMSITVSASGGGTFAVTAPNTNVSIATGAATTVTWNVVGTTASPYNVANVRITLSRDGGLTWPIVLAASTANDGSESVTIPAGTAATTQARIRVEAVGNIFFDVSDTNFTLTSSNTAPTFTPGTAIAIRQGGPSVTSTVGTVSDAQDSAGSLGLSVSGLPPELTASVVNSAGNVSVTAQATCGLVTPTSGSKTYPLNLTVTDSGGATTAGTFNVNVSSNRPPTLGTYSDISINAGASNTVSPSAAPADADNNLPANPMSVSPGSLAGGTSITVNNAGVVSIAVGGATPAGDYVISVTVTDSCGATELRRFTLTVTNTNPILANPVATVLTGNGSIEPNECNQLRVAITNTGGGAATAVSASLSTSTPGITVTQASANYPDLPASGGTGSNITPFEVSSTNSLVCASTANFTLTVNYTGGGSPSVLNFSLGVGNTPLIVLNENFDGVTAPALPAGWTTARTGATPPAFFATTTSTPNSAPNAVFSNGVSTVASNSLISPSIALPAGSQPAVLSFRHTFNFEASGGSFWDGGIVEISTNGGASFSNITALGASFTSGGYTGTIDSGFSNPISGQPAWSGAQAAYATVSATLPTSLNGQTILIRFRAGWDNTTVNANPNWRIDDVQLQAGVTCPGPGNGQCSGTPNVDRGVAVGSITLPATIAGVNNATRVRFAQVLDSVPVVIVQGDNANSDPQGVRVANVTTTGFDLLQVEPAGANCAGCTGAGPAMTVHWLAAKPGSYRMPNDVNARVPGTGVLLKVGSFSLSNSQRSTAVGGFTGWPATSFASHSFPVSGTSSLNFTSAPVVLSGLQSWSSANEGSDLGSSPVTNLNGASEVWFTPVLRNISATGFEAALESSTVDDNSGVGQGPQGAEVMGYIAIENAVSTRIVDLAGNFVGLATGNASNVTGTCTNVDLAFPTGVTINPVNLRALHSKNSRAEEDGGWVRRCGVSNPSGLTVRSQVRIDEDADVSADRSHATSETVGTAIFGGDFVTTPVTLSYMSATKQGEEMLVEFASATEVAHLGYRVWARTHSRADWQALHDDPIVSPRSDSMEAVRYSRRFAGGHWAEVRLEDIDIKGRSRFHPPLAMGETRGSIPAFQALDWSAIRASHANHPVRAGAASAEQGVLARVTADGVQRVAISQLIALGLPVNADNVNNLAVLHGDGSPRTRVLDCPSFPAQCQLEWLGNTRSPQTSLYGPEQVYRVVLDALDVRKAGTGAARMGTAALASFTERLERAPNRSYSFSAPGADPWFDERLVATTAPVSLTRNFKLPGRLPSPANAPVELQVRLFGGVDYPEDSDHHVEIWLNGQRLADRWFDGLNAETITLSVSDALLRADNELSIRLPGDTGFPADVVALDGFSVHYLRSTAAELGSLAIAEFSNGSGTTETLQDGFEARASFLLSSVQPNSVLWSEHNGRVYRDRVHADVLLPQNTTALRLVPEHAVHRPSLEVAPAAVQPSTVDYLIVSHPLFADQLASLVSLQQSRGLTVRVVRTDAIAARAGYQRDPQAIAEFIRASAPRFVLLVGGDSYDYADNLGLGSMSFIPTFYRPSDAIVRFAPSDLPFADFNGDGAPETAIGRLPVRTHEELQRAISAMVELGQRPPQSFMAVAGASQPGEQFDSSSRAQLSYLRQSQGKSYALVDEIGLTAARARTLDALAGASDWINYTGHSSPNRWAFQNLLDTSQLAGVQRSGPPAIVSQWGCWNNYFVLPNQDTMAHALMLRSNRLSGAVIGSSSLAEDQSHLALSLRVFDLIEDGRFDERAMPAINTLGEALQHAKVELLRLHPEHLNSSYSITLFGDPAQPLR